MRSSGFVYKKIMDAPKALQNFKVSDAALSAWTCVIRQCGACSTIELEKDA